MKESGYYPPGAEFDPKAPWNQVEYPEKEFDVTVSLTLSKPFTVETNDYNYEDPDGDGYGYYDTLDTDFKRIVKEQCYLPHTAIKRLKELLKDNDNKEVKNILDDLDGWFEDDYEVERD